MKVDFYSTQSMPKSLKKDYEKVFRKTLNQDSLIDGDICRKFEGDFSSYLGSNHVLGVGNGFDALRLSLLALGITHGDRVAVPAHTFIATWFAIQSVGATPVGIDVTFDGQINLDLLELENDLKCVIPVHMHGTHCDMSRLTKWAKMKKIFVIEDCAQAAGLTIQGKKAGTWGDLGSFSFYPTKNLFALGDAGAITTNDENLFERARSISRYGSSRASKYIHERLGQNSRLDSIQAAFLSINLKYIDEWNEHRILLASLYNEKLKNFRQEIDLRNSHVYHHYVIYSELRDELQEYLQKRNISTEIHYPVLASSEVAASNQKFFQVASYLTSAGISLPLSPWQSKKETILVAKVVEEFLND
jgi:dTDP-4-amino-4,6-dideoxygalactose transaminase